VATKLAIEETEHTVRTLTRRAAGHGHELKWVLGDNARRAGHAYHKVGTCQRCGATAVAGPSYSSSHGPIDARNKPCPRRGQKQP
jgi:hypothetical protein